MPFKAIAAMSENRVIGDHGKIPWHLPEDFRWFKHKTMGGTLVMGRKTFESIGKPLPGRRTIVLTRGPVTIPDVEVCPEPGQLPDDGTIWICGGEQIYRQLLPRCHFLYLSRVKRQVSGDAFFPEFEDTFQLEQVIHDNGSFRVERWANVRLPSTSNAPEAWPFPPIKT